MLRRGDVARIDYLWPHEERKKRGKDMQGSKDRPCTVLDEIKIGDKTAAIRVIPHHGIVRGKKPDPEDLPYAVKLTSNVQRSAGLVDKDKFGRPKAHPKESWILAHRSNVLHVPQNPAILRTQDTKGNPSWFSGTMPEAVLKEIALKREKAIRDGVLPDEQNFFIGKGGIEENYRKEREAAERNAGSGASPKYSSESKRGQMEARTTLNAKERHSQQKTQNRSVMKQSSR